MIASLGCSDYDNSETRPGLISWESKGAEINWLAPWAKVCHLYMGCSKASLWILWMAVHDQGDHRVGPSITVAKSSHWSKLWERLLVKSTDSDFFGKLVEQQSFSMSQSLRFHEIASPIDWLVNSPVRMGFLPQLLAASRSVSTCAECLFIAVAECWPRMSRFGMIFCIYGLSICFSMVYLCLSICLSILS